MTDSEGGRMGREKEIKKAGGRQKGGKFDFMW